MKRSAGSQAITAAISFTGGNSDDGKNYGRTILVHPSDGSVFVSGDFGANGNGADYTMTLGAGGQTLTRQGIRDMFVVKLDSNLAVQSAVSFGGSGAGTTTANCMAVDDNSVYVAGNFNSAVSFGGTVLRAEV